MSNFAAYLQSRQSAFETMAQSLKKDVTTDVRQGDDRQWKPKMGTDGTGYAVIRFLPGLNANKTPWIKMYDHAFQGPAGKWYIENSLTTIGQKDPVSEYNTKLWNSGIESNKDVVRKQKRRTSYYANVLVLKDPSDPTSEGKVKIYKFGQKIFDKLMGALQPEFAGDEPLNPFDIIDGANFRIKLKTVAGYWNYDSSEFERPSPLSEDESKLESIFNAQHDIHDLISADKFKSYDELADKLKMVLEGGESSTGFSAPAQAAAPKAVAAPAPIAKTAATSSTAVEDDDLESYFKSLAE
jgi:hypothetical protein